MDEPGWFVNSGRTLNLANQDWYERDLC